MHGQYMERAEDIIFVLVFCNFFIAFRVQLIIRVSEKIHFRRKRSPSCVSPCYHFVPSTWCVLNDIDIVCVLNGCVYGSRWVNDCTCFVYRCSEPHPILERQSSNVHSFHCKTYSNIKSCRLRLQAVSSTNKHLIKQTCTTSAIGVYQHSVGKDAY